MSLLEILNLFQKDNCTVTEEEGNEKETVFENKEDDVSSEDCPSSDDEYELPLRPFNRYKGVILDKVHHFLPP